MLLDGSSLDKISRSEDLPVKGSNDDIETHVRIAIEDWQYGQGPSYVRSCVTARENTIT
tara:strand:+ start:11412 stop:11588 length:177 start_codon:yes stop_codon:yes gene_type:complete